MNKYKCHETEKRNGNYAKIIDIYSGTRIRGCTSEWIIYEITTDGLWFLEDVVKEFEKYTRNSHEKYIPENRSSLGKSIGYHEG